jgi:hypothetical protein
MIAGKLLKVSVASLQHHASRKLEIPGLVSTEFSLLMAGVSAHTMARFYLAVLQAKLLYGSEMLVLSDRLMRRRCIGTFPCPMQPCARYMA